MKQEFYPTDMEDHVRIDKYLAEACPDLSRSYIQKLLKSGQVLVNGQGVKVSYIVEEDDRIELEVPEAVEPEIDAEPMDLDILYEDQDLILINKPKGMVVHPAAGHYSHTLVNGLMYHCKDQLSGINGVMRPGIVHRIDMDTTGVIIACKNDMAHSSIAAQLKEHSITRRYQAIVHGVIAEDEGTVDAPIGRHPVERKKMSINYQNGKNAVTHYRVLNRFRQYTHVECRLETGRTHQIRVHMKYIGHTLFNDERYGGHDILKGTTFTKYKQFVQNCFAICPRQALHAKTLGFVHPTTGEEMFFDSEIPSDMQQLIDRWRVYANTKEL